jgi:TonB family protein
MSSFRVVNRKKRLLWGIGTVLFIGVSFSVIFYFTEPRYREHPLMMTEILKEKDIGTIPFYEARADAQCITVLNEGVTPQPKKPSKNPLDAPLVQASAPTCKGVTSIPAEHAKLGKDGFVTLMLTVDKTGKIERGEVEKSSGFVDLDELAVKQVAENWSLEPCKKLDKAVACKQKIKFRWAAN